MSDIRKVLHSAYAFIRGAETNKATSSLTIDHLIEEQIQRLKQGETRAILDSTGQDTGSRPSRWDVIDALVKNVDQVVDAIENAGDDQDRASSVGLQETP